MASWEIPEKKQYANSFKRIWEDGSTAKLWQSYVTNLPGLRTRSTKRRRHFFFPSKLNIPKNSSSSQSSQLFSTIIPSLSPTFSFFLENLHLCQALMNELVVPSEEHGRSFYAPAPKPAAEKAEEVEAWSWEASKGWTENEEFWDEFVGPPILWERWKKPRNKWTDWKCVGRIDPFSWRSLNSYLKSSFPSLASPPDLAPPNPLRRSQRRSPRERAGRGCWTLAQNMLAAIATMMRLGDRWLRTWDRLNVTTMYPLIFQVWGKLGSKTG